MKKNELKSLIDEAAERGASAAVRRLYQNGKLKKIKGSAFRKTEEVLYLYSKLPEDHPERIRIDRALANISDDEHRDIIASKYFDGMTIEDIAGDMDCSTQAVLKQRNKLIKMLSHELFPEDVLREIMEG